MEANHRCCRLTVSGTGNEIEQAAFKAVQVGEEAGQPDLLTWFAPQLFVALWSQGRHSELLDLTRQVAADTPGVPAWRAAVALACAQLGERDEAVSTLEELMTDPSTVFPENVVWLLGHSVLAEAVAVGGTAEQAAREYPLLAPYAGRVPCLGNIARPAISLWLAMLAVRAGWPERAEQHFAAAHEQHDRLGATAWLARTRLEWARSLLAAGELGQARILLAEARASAEQMGAADVLVAAETLLASVAEMPDRGH
jgi:hypothetical protein